MSPFVKILFDSVRGLVMVGLFLACSRDPGPFSPSEDFPIDPLSCLEGENHESEMSMSSCMKLLFDQPLIVGASVSAGVGSKSPGHRLAERYSSSGKKTLTHARPGQTGLAVLKTLPDSAIEKSSIIIGIDLFFWDSTRQHSCQQSQKALKELVERSESVGSLLILGNIPELLGSSRQPCRKALNQDIGQLCKDSRFCRMLNLDVIHRGVQKNRGLQIEDRLYTMRELVPDGLHLSDVASIYLSEEIENLLATP